MKFATRDRPDKETLKAALAASAGHLARFETEAAASAIRDWNRM